MCQLFKKLLVFVIMSYIEIRKTYNRTSAVLTWNLSVRKLLLIQDDRRTTAIPVPR